MAPCSSGTCLGASWHALEQLHRTQEVPELLALHFGRRDEAEKAIDYAILAGERAQRRWANSQALSYFSDALRVLGAAPNTESNRLRRIDAVMKQGELKLALGRHAEHLGALEQISRIVDEIDDPHRQAAWHYWAGFLQILTGGGAAVAIRHCQQAAEIVSRRVSRARRFYRVVPRAVYIVAGELRAAIEAGSARCRSSKPAEISGGRAGPSGI
jgi:hypothetical protein